VLFSNREIPALAECSPKHRWETKKDRHAALVMIGAAHHELKYEGCLHRFLQTKPQLADKAVVTKVYKCNAYARLITETGRTGEVYVGFKANISPSSSAASGINSTAEFDQLWQTFSDAGVWTTGTRVAPDQSEFTPLVTLRQIMPKDPASGFRDPLPPPIADEDEMRDYIPPWGELDEEGNEIDEDD
jgi:hypothetical protein